MELALSALRLGRDGQNPVFFFPCSGGGKQISGRPNMGFLHEPQTLSSYWAAIWDPISLVVGENTGFQLSRAWRAQLAFTTRGPKLEPGLAKCRFFALGEGKKIIAFSFAPIAQRRREKAEV